MAKVYFIGGAPRAGKTTVIEKLIEAQPMLGASTDAIRNVAKGMIKPEDNPRLFKTERGPFNSSSNVNNLSNNHQTVLNYELGESEETWKAVLKFIEYNLRDGRDVAIEGVAVLPHNIPDLSFDFRVVFVANLSDQTETILEHAHDNTFDWLHKYDDQTIRAFCSFNRTHNQYYYDEAKKYDLPVVTVGDKFQESIDEAVRILKD